jgi:hypothetical protein
MKQSHPARRAGEPSAGVREIARVSVEADEQAVPTEAVGDRRGVTSPAERAIDHGHPRSGAQSLDHLVQQDRVVTMFGLGHAEAVSLPIKLRTTARFGTYGVL